MSDMVIVLALVVLLAILVPRVGEHCVALLEAAGDFFDALLGLLDRD